MIKRLKQRLIKCWFCRGRHRKEWVTVHRKGFFIVDGKREILKRDRLVCTECRAYVD
jgi:hypothetical protein